MARNGSGTYTIPNTYSDGQTETAAIFNQNFSDIGAEITNSLAIDGQSIMTGQLKAANGSVSLPAYTFGSDLNSGFYRIGADEIGAAVNGAKVLDISTTGLVVTGTLDASGGIAANAVVAASIAAGAVTTTKIADANVTSAKLAANAVVTAGITDANVTTAKIADANVTYAKVQNVTNNRLLGNFSGSAAAPSEYSLGKSFVASGSALNLVFNVLAFVTFTMSGTTITVRASYNVSGVVRNAAGDFTISFTSALADIYYAPVGNGSVAGNNLVVIQTDADHPPTTTAYRFLTHNNGGVVDATICSVVFFGN